MNGLPVKALLAAVLIAGGMARAEAMPICGSERRVTCVVDGDTVWINREKIRLMDIDAPEVRGRCPQETKLAAAATLHLQAFLSKGPITIERHGTDRYGRTLARLSVGGRQASDHLVATGAAVIYRDPVNWCSNTP